MGDLLLGRPEALAKFSSNEPRSAKRRTPGLVNFVTALAYHFCLALPAALTQPGDHLFAELCRKNPLPLPVPEKRNVLCRFGLNCFCRCGILGIFMTEKRSGLRRESGLEVESVNPSPLP